VRRLFPLCALAAAVLAGCGGGGGSGSDTAAASLLSSALSAKVPPAVELPRERDAARRHAAQRDRVPGDHRRQRLHRGDTGPPHRRHRQDRAWARAAAPAYADPANPTAAELRRNALYSNYRGILDPSVAGGYGRFYGPNIKADGTVTSDEGLIPGVEYVASLDDGTGHKRVVMAVQIPDSFDHERPCIVLGPSSGSRGFYGAIGTAGDWGLKRGCAVALTDAGKGVGLHDLGDDTVNRIDGTRATRAAAGALAQFAADITESARVAFNAVLPNRFALKHAHSQQNPEKDWGSDTLAAAQYAFFALNDRFGQRGKTLRFDKSNTLVIAGSASNGGAAVLRAAELDSSGLIDGVVAPSR
jgi:hydroxybutyrate-dimer hydrolase